MLYLGDFKAGKTVELAVDTEANGLPSTLSAATVKVYKGSSTTTEVTTGVTHSEDFDTLTGLNHVTVDLSSDGSFYAAGNEFAIVLTAGTLSGASIRRVLAMFSIENRAVNWAQVCSPTTTVNLSGTTVGIVTALASGAIAAAAFAANALDAVWSTATRLLTAGTNIVLAKGVGVTGFNDLDAAGTRTAVGLASANLDTQLLTIAAYIDTEVAAIKAKTDNLPASPAAVGSAMTLTSGERDSIADAHLDRTAAIETGLTPRQALRLVTAAEAGKLSGAATATVTIRNAVADSKARITATVDSDGNRSAVTTDVT